MINFYDKIVIVLFVVLAILSFPFVILVDADEKEGPPVASVKVDGKKVMSVSLDKELKPTVIRSKQGAFTIEVRDHAISMVKADCPDQLCVRRGPVGPGEEVVCLPLRTVISVSGEMENELDVISR